MRSTARLFRLFSLRYLHTRKLRAFLGLSAVALGVALFVSSRVTTSVRRSLQATMQSLAGKAEWEVTRGRSLGVEETLLPRLRQRLPGVIAAPVIQSSVVLRDPPGGGTLLILGVDFQSDSLLRLYRFQGQIDISTFVTVALVPDSIVVARSFAEQYHLRAGSVVKVGTRQGLRALTITGILENEGPARAFGGSVAIMELHAAQRLFGRPGFVDRIEVAHTSREALQRACPGYSIAPVARMTSMAGDALARIDSLAAVSVIAFLVGLLIIYNSVQVSVVERLKEIGTLRALGATRRQILSLLLFEWLVVGLLGSLAGIALGRAVAQAALGYTSQALNSIVPIFDLRDVTLTPGISVTAVLLGSGATLIATFIPARAAALVHPLDLLRPHGHRLSLQRYRTGFRVGLSLSCAGGVLVTLTTVSRLVGLLATALVFLGVALLVPQVVVFCALRARGALQRLFGLEGFLAADNIIKFPQRTGLTAVTLGGALAMMVATATLVGGIRTATSHWITQAFPWDLAIMGTDFSSRVYTQQATTPGSLVPIVGRIPGVENVYGVRMVFADFRGQDILIGGVEMEPYLRMHRKRGLNDWARNLSDPAEVAEVKRGSGLYISENFGALFQVRPGDHIVLPTPSGPRSFRVLKAIEDYSWPHGLIMLDLDVLKQLWKDDALTYIDIGVADGVSVDTVRTRIAERLTGRYGLYLYDRPQIQRLSEDVLRQTVAVADVQVIVAVVIGFLGIVNSLLISVLQRHREIGLLRAVGMTRRQVARTVVLEGVFIALIGGVLGVVGGLIGGWLPVRLFAFAVTGYLFPRVVPWNQVALALLAALVIGLLASLLPARRAAELNVLDAIGYE